MIVGLDSSYDAPSAGQADAARAAGVRMWSGYLATRAGVGLAAPWPWGAFENARRCGSMPIAFVSGRDDPAAVQRQAAAWHVRHCLDVEPGIRTDGPWVQAWLDASGAGLYGLASVHRGRRAAFHVVARYPGAGCGAASWDPEAGPRPDAPCGWQCQGSHPEFGCQVDRGTFDDWFGEGERMFSPEDIAAAAVETAYAAYLGRRPESQAAIDGHVQEALARGVSAAVSVIAQSAEEGDWLPTLRQLVADYRAGKLGGAPTDLHRVADALEAAAEELRT